MSEQNRESAGIFSSIFFFVIAISSAVILLMASAVVWIGELIGSGALAWLIVAAVLLLIAWMIYFLAARQSIEKLNQHLDLIYNIASAASNAYHSALKLINSILGETLWPKTEK